MKIAILLLIVWALTSCGVTVRTPYGDVSYDQPVKYDGKTALR